MRIKTLVSMVKNFILFFCIFGLFTASAYAHNSLSGINVLQKNGGYDIVLKADSSVKINKYTDEKDSLTLFLSSVIPADSVEIDYDNASGVRNVIVQKKNDKNTTILFQGKNIEAANIYIKDLASGQIKSLDSDSFSTALYIGNLKYFLFALSGVFVMFFLMLLFRPKSKKYTSPSYEVKNRIKTNQTTIRSKQYNVGRVVPSINYKINYSKSNMTIPKDFVISEYQNYTEEKVRKVG